MNATERAVRVGEDGVAAEQHALAVRAGRPVHDRAAREVAAGLGQGDAGQDLDACPTRSGSPGPAGRPTPGPPRPRSTGTPPSAPAPLDLDAEHVRVAGDDRRRPRRARGPAVTPSSSRYPIGSQSRFPDGVRTQLRLSARSRSSAVARDPEQVGLELGRPPPGGRPPPAPRAWSSAARRRAPTAARRRRSRTPRPARRARPRRSRRSRNRPRGHPANPRFRSWSRAGRAARVPDPHQAAWRLSPRVRADVDRQRATTRRNGRGPAVRDTDGRTAGGDQASAAARRVAACSLSQLLIVASRSSR